MSKQEEQDYQEYQAQEQQEQIKQLLGYRLYRGWLVNSVRSDTSIPESLVTILDLCAQLVTVDIRDREDIVAQIEEELR